jgi:TetR/AcrR family transcriptional repressor of bet genes
VADGPKFSRESPDVRRRALIDAAALCLAERGPGETSVREVCRRAGVSPGLLRHYFGGIAALIAATYRDTGDRVAAELAAALASAPDDPALRLRAFVDASFRPPLLDRALLATWLSFWSLVARDDAIRAIHRDIYAGYRATLEALIAAAGERHGRTVDGPRAAFAFTALLDGLWLELCLDPATFPPEDAIDIANGWLDGLLRGGGLGLARSA